MRNSSTQRQSPSTYAAVFSKVISQLIPHTCFRTTYSSELNITSQVLSHTANLIFTTTKEGGIISIRPSTELRKMKCQALVPNTAQMWVPFSPSFSSSYKAHFKCHLSQEAFLHDSGQMSCLPLGSHGKLRARSTVGMRL